MKNYTTINRNYIIRLDGVVRNKPFHSAISARTFDALLLALDGISFSTIQERLHNCKKDVCEIKVRKTYRSRTAHEVTDLRVRFYNR